MLPTAPSGSYCSSIPPAPHFGNKLWSSLLVEMPRCVWSTWMKPRVQQRQTTDDMHSCFPSGAWTEVAFWLSFELLQYDWSEHLIQSSLPALCLASIQVKAAKRSFNLYHKNNKLSCSTDRGTRISETSFTSISLFPAASLTAAKMIHWPRVSLLAPQQAPNSFLALQVQQKSPERATKAQQTAQLPCPASHQTHILPSQG